MKQKRILSVQDISCFGKCSNTVALPVLSAADIEAVILPTALLSNHTGFDGYTFLDLTEEMHRIQEEWVRTGLKFDVIYTGYFGSAEQLSDIAAHREALLKPDGWMLVDPVLGDRGRLYSIYDDGFVRAMRQFCRGADLITPNVTEACLLADIPYEGDAYDAGRMQTLLDTLQALTGGTVVITGVRFGEAEIGVVCREKGEEKSYTMSSPRSDAPLHGTGDVFTAALAAYCMNGFPLREALTRTLRFVYAAVRDTEAEMDGHWYGVKFEGSLALLCSDIQNKRLKDVLEKENPL
jgi:pyridoxine kinase